MKIWVVDCERLLQKTIQNFLENLGYEVEIFSDNDFSATNLSKGNRPELIIFNQQIETLSCNSKLVLLNRVFPNVPIIVLSNRISPNITVDEALKFCVFSFLKQPLQLLELELQIALVQRNRSSDNDRKSGDNVFAE